MQFSFCVEVYQRHFKADDSKIDSFVDCKKAPNETSKDDFTVFFKQVAPNVPSIVK